MTAVQGQIAFVVWRECIEALLVVGILHAWLAGQADARAVAAGKRYLWAGAAAGLAAAAALALVVLSFASLLDGDRQDYFQIAMAGVAALLIVRMVAWMRGQGSALRKDLEKGAERAAAQARWWSLAGLAAIAVAREGSETVVFLYGIVAAAGTRTGGDAAAAAGGLALAGATYWLLQAAARRLPWRVFFRVSEVLLLALAAALVMTAFDRAAGLDLVPLSGGPLWDTSWLLDDGGPLGGFVAAMTGYRARPDLASVVVFAVFWIAAAALMRSRPHRPAVAAL